MLSRTTLLLAAVCLALDIPEGSDPTKPLGKALKEIGMSPSDLETEAAAFKVGYVRGLGGRPLNQDSAGGTLVDGRHVPNAELWSAVENGYTFGLEARSLALTPSAGPIFDAFKSGALQPGNLATWFATNSEAALTAGHRLAAAIEVGAGPSAFKIPAGTPIDFIKHAEVDGVRTAYIWFDGVVVRVPDPVAEPVIVPGTTQVAAVTTGRKARQPKEGGGEKAPRKARQPSERNTGPTLHSFFLQVISDGPGPLRTNGEFAGEMFRVAGAAGAPDKVATFVEKNDIHVPYYINAYKFTKEGEVGRLGVKNPVKWIVAAIQLRARFLKTDASLSFEARLRAAGASDADVALIITHDNNDTFAGQEAPAAPAQPDATNAG